MVVSRPYSDVVEPDARPEGRWAGALEREFPVAPERSRRMSAFVALSTLWCGLHAAFGSTQEQQPVRSGVELVELDVLALDRNRRPVRGLTEHDFTIVENGVTRPIRAFAAIELPAPANANTPVAESFRDVVSNTVADQGRLVVIVFDRSIPAGTPTIAAKAVARAAIDALGPDDQAAVVRTSGFASEGRTQNFTADRRRLLAAADSAFIGWVSPPVMTSGGLQAAPPESLNTGDCFCGLCSLEALQHVAESLTSVGGRHQKIILFIGADIVIAEDGGAPGQCSGRVGVVRDATLRALDRSNTVVHSIDPTALETLTASADQRSPLSLRPSNLRRQGHLEVLPSYTGGRTVRNTNEPAALIPQIFSETASYYVLGFERGHADAETRQRRIDVRVNRRGVTVKTRRAYYPATPPSIVKPADVVEDVIAGVLPVSDIPLALSLPSTFSASGDVTTHALIGVDTASGRRFDNSAAVQRRTNSSAGTPPRLEFRLAVLDDRGKQVFGGQQTFEWRPGPCVAGWCEAVSQLSLRPGQYEVRVGVIDREAARKGSVYAYVDVPALRPRDLLLSDLQLGAATTAGQLAVPTMRRTFGSHERITSFAQIHRPIDARDPVTVAVVIGNSGSTTVSRTEHLLPSAHFSSAGVSEFRIDHALSTLSPGTYFLTLEAACRDQKTTRSVAFEVR